MKCQKPNTDQNCEVTIFADGAKCAEYILDPETSTRTPKPSVVDCFIPVSEGEKLSVKVNFKGTVLHGCVDIIADGAFVYDRHIEGDKTGRLKYQKRDWHISQIYDIPDHPERGIPTALNTVVAGSLHVK